MQEDNPLAWPKQEDKARIARYKHSDLLYGGDHYSAFSIKGKNEFNERYKRLRYVACNFAKISTNVMADMLFGSNPTIDVKGSVEQQYIDALVEQNDLYSQLWESQAGNSRRGDSLFKLRIGKRHPNDEDMTTLIEEVTPAIYFPVLDTTIARNVPRQDVIAEVLEIGGETLLRKEIHEPGYIYNELYRYDPSSEKITATLNPSAYGFEEVTETGVKRSLIFHIPNVRDGRGFFGTSDYEGLESLFFATNNRVTSVDNILDKHSDPILAVPPGVIDEKGQIKKESLGMFEVDNQSEGFNKPEYIVWNANLESAENQIDNLLNMLYMFSEIAPATLGMDKNGIAESGRALKFRMIATIRKRNRKMRYYDMALKYMLLTAQELAIVHGIKIEGIIPTSPEKPQIKWNDRIINDEVEAVEIATARIDNGTWATSDAIADLDHMSPDDAKKKAKEIEDENKSSIMPIQSNVKTNIQEEGNSSSQE